MGKMTGVERRSAADPGPAALRYRLHYFQPAQSRCATPESLTVLTKFPDAS